MSSNSYVNAKLAFKRNGVLGMSSNPTITFNDGGGQSHEVTILGGIITSWVINGAQQLI
jgi:hypothetical protein